MKSGIFLGSTMRIAASILAALILTACAPQAKKRVDDKKISAVEVAHPIKRDVQLWDEYTAKIEGQKSVEVRARVNGYLEKIDFKDGDYVKEGQLLFEIDPRTFEAAFDGAQAVVDEIEARVTLASENMNRGLELAKANAISKEILGTRKSELAAANALLMSAKAKLREAKLNLEFTRVHAPVSGYVSKRYVDEGNLVAAGETLLARIVSRDVVYAYFDVSERDVIRYVKSGLFESVNPEKAEGPAVQLMLMGEKTPSHFGYLSYVDNRLDAASIELRADVDNKTGSLYPGMFAKVRLSAGKPQPCLLLPEHAVGTDLVGRYVLTVDSEGMVEYKPVEVAELTDGMQIIKSGISADDRVVINGLQRAVPKTKVNAVLKELE